MKKQDFIEALKQAGWRAVHDAQHEQIAMLHRELFPVVAELEDELKVIKIENGNTKNARA